MKENKPDVFEAMLKEHLPEEILKLIQDAFPHFIDNEEREFWTFIMNLCLKRLVNELKMSPKK